MIHLTTLLLALASSSPDSAVLSAANQKLSDRDTLGAIDLLQDWSQDHLVSPVVTDLLDALQLPEPAGTLAEASDSASPSAGSASPRLWSAKAEGVFRPDRDLPALGGLDLQRKFPLSAKTGDMDLLAGFSAGSWLEDASPYADLDLWTGLEIRRPQWDARVQGWGGWTERNQPEAGISGNLSTKKAMGAWEFRQGPVARFSWRRTRFAGWFLQGSGPSDLGGLDLGLSARVRQDPPWPALLDDENKPVRFARARAQGTFHAALERAQGFLRFGPQLDLDGRVSLSPDRWTDSASTGTSIRKPITTARSELRAELGCSAGGFLRWIASPVWSAQAEIGWTLALLAGGFGSNLSPFPPGPFLRIAGRSNF